MDNMILVLYVDVGNMEDKDVTEFVRRVSKGLLPEEVVRNLDATVFVIPRRGEGTRLECINPHYVLDQDLFDQYRKNLEILNENLNHFIVQKAPVNGKEL